MLNQCSFIGRLGRDVESRFTQDGTQVSSFSIACGEKYKDKQGNMQEKTEWINVSTWGRLASICSEYLQKGALVYISGKLQTRKWQDQNGNDRYTTEIVAHEMKMLSGKKSSQGGHESTSEQPDMGEDVPF